MCSYMYWIRDIEVFAGKKKFTNLGDDGLEIEFEIPFSDKNEPDISTVIIYNLSDNTINDIQRDGYIYVNAGYKELKNKGNILTGEIEKVETTWEGLDKITTITVSDGAKKWRTTTFNKTYKEDTRASQIMTDLANAMNYEIVDITPNNDITYKLGKTLKGSASAALLQLVKDTESKMFINKNRIVIRKQGKGHTTGFVLNSNSGLIGSPTLNKNETGDKTDSVEFEKTKKKNQEEKKTWTVVSLLNPKFETDSLIQVESKSLNGVYRIISGKHTREFNTELEVEEV